jgi:hypothetical protein
MEVAFHVIVALAIEWALVFGGLGALLAGARDGSPIEAALLGVLLGPVGWAATWWRTRSSRAPAELDDPYHDIWRLT